MKGNRFPMADYKSIFTGTQVDEAVGRVLNQLQAELDALESYKLVLTTVSNELVIQKDGTTVTFTDIKGFIEDTPRYVYLVYNEEIYSPVLCTTDAIDFASVLTLSENVSTKRVSISSSDVVSTGTISLENTANKVTSVSAASTNEQYPTAKLLYDSLAEKQDSFVAGDSISIDNGVINVKTAVLGYETLDILTDAKGYADVYKYEHSSFDISKFTVTGSPAVSADGVLGNISSANYLTLTTSYILSKDTPFTIYCSFETPSELTSGQHVIYGRNSNIELAIKDTSTLYFSFLGSEATWGITLEAGTKYDSIVVYDGVRVVLQCKKASDEVYTSSPNVNISSATTVNLDINIGTEVTTTSKNFEGLIDLKTFRIYLGNVLYFTGNKTGVDTIKAVDYTVVGTNTVSDDGVISQYSYTNQVRKTGLDLLFNELTLEGTFIWDGTSAGGNSGLFCFRNNGDSEAIVAYLNAQNRACVYFKVSNSISYPFSVVPITANIPCTIRVFRTTASATLTIIQNGTVLSEQTVEGTTPILSSNAVFEVVGAAGLLGSSTLVDLNSIKVYGYEKLIYQPCLKIPYILGNYSKIASASYRARIADAYAQGFPQIYFTIDSKNKNYTLPMGELYGMIESKSPEYNIATATKVGTVKPGSHLTIDANGALSAVESSTDTLGVVKADNSTITNTNSTFSVNEANLTNVVHKTGDETIAGVKRFDNQPTINIQQSGTASETSTAIPNMGWVNDVSGAQNVVHRSGNAETISSTKTFSAQQLITATLSDSSSTSDTHIPNMGWVNDPAKSTNVVHRSGTETITGDKTFNGNVSLGSGATATTPASGDNSTKVATTAFVNNYVTGASTTVIIRDWSQS